MYVDPSTTANPPILFLHGVFGMPSLLAPWANFLEAAGYTVHAPALPGREPKCRLGSERGAADLPAHREALRR